MGCTSSTEAKAVKSTTEVIGEDSPEPKPPPTFAKNPKLNKKDFMTTDGVDLKVVKLPGSINGQQYVVEDCTGCDIYVFDHTDSVTIDECKDCRIFIGPCESSVFIRDCKRCTFVVATRQFRTRSCNDCDIFLYATTEPIIEMSSKLRIGCFDLSYFSLLEHFSKARMSVWNNKWSEVFDFTPDGGGASRSGNWTPALTDINHASLLRVDPETAESIGYDREHLHQAVPKTTGVRNVNEDADTCLLCVHSCAGEVGTIAATAALERVKQHPQLSLVRTRELTIEKAQTNQLVPKDKAFSIAASRGPIIAMQFVGDGCPGILSKVFLSDDAIFVSPDVFEGRRQVELLFESWKEKV